MVGEREVGWGEDVLGYEAGAGEGRGYVESIGQSVYGASLLSPLTFATCLGL